MSTTENPVNQDSATKGPLRVIDGRAFNEKLSETLWYSLPADEEEHSRLDLQHLMLKLAVGGLYSDVEAVRRALKDGQAQAPTILDIGTGSGSWAVEMAKEFPHARVQGFDISAPAIMSKPDRIPSNCSFRVADIKTEIDVITETFNFVHVRAVWNLEDYHHFIQQLARIVKPGGVLILANCTGDLQDDNGNLLPVLEEGQSGFTWYPKAFEAVILAGRKVAGGRRVNGMEYWTRWLKENPFFGNAKDQNYVVPCGAVKEGMDDKEKRIREIHNFSLTNLFEVWKTVMIRSGVDPEVAKRYAEGTAKDMKDPNFSAALVWRYTTAVRNEKEWAPSNGESPTYMKNSHYGWTFEKE